MIALRSLRARLLVLVIGTNIVAWSAAAVWLQREAHRQMDALFDAHLAQSARLLLAQAHHELDEDDDDDGEELELPTGGKHPYERRTHFQVWDTSGRLRFRSTASTPASPMTTGGDGFHDEMIAGAPWRVFSLWDHKHRVQIQIGQEHRARDELLATIVTRTLAPALVGLLVLSLLLGWAVRRALHPLHALAQDVSRRAPDHLSPLQGLDVPAEVAPLVAALNTLLHQLDRALTAERALTADAAHELRTPLAAIKAQAEVARDTADDAARRHALGQLVTAVDRTTHLVTQLLTLARLDPQHGLPDRGPTDLRALARDVLAELAPSALARHTELALADGPSPVVTGNAPLLATLIRNLVDNAIRHSPAGGTVELRLLQRPDAVGLDVVDQGPGIPAAERDAVFRRFYRAPGAGEGGSGLGLPIVRRIAELHGATLTLDAGDDGRGLRVSVHWRPTT